jgi:plasmid maintenance system antidote protein VapI
MRNATNTLLDEVRKALSVESDYALAKRLGVRQQTITSYRSGRTQMTEEISIRVAGIVGRSPALLFMQIAAERAKNPNVAGVWREAAKVFAQYEAKRAETKRKPGT